MLRYGHLPLIGLAILVLGAAVFTAVADRTAALKLVQQSDNAHKAGNFAEAERLSEQALKYAHQQYGENSGRVAEILELRGALFSDEHKYDLAEAEYLKARTLRQHLSGLESAEHAHVNELLGTFYTDRGKFAEAEECLKSALHIVQALKLKEADKPDDWMAQAMEILRGPQDPNEARILSELAWLYSKQGRFDEAEKYYKEAMTVRERILPPNHPAIKKNAHDLAFVASLQRKF